MIERFDCRGCGTVYAAVDRPERCGDCGSEQFVTLADGDAAADFFAGALR